MNGVQALFKALTDAGLDTCFANPGPSEMLAWGNFWAYAEDKAFDRGVPRINPNKTVTMMGSAAFRRVGCFPDEGPRPAVLPTRSWSSSIGKSR